VPTGFGLGPPAIKPFCGGWLHDAVTVGLHSYLRVRTAVAAGSVGGRCSARETAAATARCAGAERAGACPPEPGGCGCRAGAATAVTIIGVRIETVRGVGYRIVAS